MSFARDVDLLRYEPGIFDDVRWAGQRTIAATTGQVTGGALLANGIDDAFMDGGYVVLLGGVAYEMIGKSGQAVMVSLVRWEEGSTWHEDVEFDEINVEGFTFRPQLEAVHGQLMRSVGVEPGDAESVVVNGAAMVEMEAFGALYTIYAGASMLSAELGAYERKAMLYRDRLRSARSRAVVELDLDGDGAVDARRRLGVMQLVRG